ncbi:unnamed protein product [Polarella glacialis]|uniref:Annexin n=1 Tax=Polarella glacialis TaxID=89957 RepID=A0A813GJN9_POLGL|nr:unnamed protein product [Polarella glacialis]
MLWDESGSLILEHATAPLPELGLQPFIDILCQANTETCKAICDAYDELPDSKKSLLEAVESKMGGDLEFAVIARLRSKSEFMAVRIFKACKGWGTDEECIGRVISCMTKAEAQQMEEHYNNFFKDEETPFQNLRQLLASELSGSFLEAMLALIDISGPKGHSVHEETYPVEAERVAKYFAEQVSEKYSDATAQQLGMGPLQGPLLLCGIEGLFICDGFDVALPASRPVFVQADRAHLLEGEPEEDLVSAQTLLDDLLLERQAVTSATQGAQREYMAFKELVVPERARSLKYLDHFLQQMLTDNASMLEFCASRDADFVHEAVEGWGTDEDKLIRVLCALPKKQLQRVDMIYTERYGKSLREVTDSELGGMFEGDFKYFMKCVLTKEVELDAELLKESMQGWGTNDGLLCELLCTRSNRELTAAKAILAESGGGKTLQDLVEGDTSQGSYQALLLACLRAERDESLGKTDEAAAKQQATQLYHAGFGGGDGEVDGDVICDILSRAYAHGTPMVEAIKESMGGDWEKALLARCHDKPTYYATALEGAFQGWGTDERAISRILGRSSKPEVRRIATRFKQLFGRSLRDAIEAEVSGNFKKALLTMLFEEAPGEKLEGEEQSEEEEKLQGEEQDEEEALVTAFGSLKSFRSGGG